MNLPNALTVLRMMMIPAFAYEYYHAEFRSALIIFLLASATDYLDGYLARKWNQITAFGKLFDPLADKLMLLTALFCLADTGKAPWWVFGVMIAKECFLVAGSLFMLGKKVVVYSNYFGKVATVLFIAAVALLFPWHHTSALCTVGNILLYIALCSSVLALFAYIHRAAKNRPEGRSIDGD